MRVEQLEYFLAASTSGNFAVAAENCFVSQSTLSKQIKKLEEELGFLLFDRSGRSARLTEAGIVFQEHANRLIRDYQEMLTAVAPFRDKSGFSIRIYSLPVLAAYGLLDRFQAYRIRFPDCRLQVNECNVSDAVWALQNGQADIILTRGAVAEKKFAKESTYEIHCVIPDKPALLVSRNHPFASRKSMPLLEAKDETFHLLRYNTLPYIEFYNNCLKIGFTPHVSPLSLDAHSIAHTIQHYGGVSLLAEQVARYNAAMDEGICVVSITEDMDLCLYAIIRSDCEPYVREMVDFISEVPGE